MKAQSNDPIHPFDAIASKFNHPEMNRSSSTNAAASGKVEAGTSQSVGIGFPHPITPETIKEPAIILSRDLRVIWQNQGANTQIWHKSTDSGLINEEMDIFDIIYDSHFQNTVNNWRQWVAFFIRQAMAMLSVDELERLFSLKMDWQSEALLAMLTDFQPMTSLSTYQGHLQRIANDEIETFQVVGLNFDRGRLLVFESVGIDSSDAPINSPQRHLISRSFDLTKAIEQQTKVPVAILCARLNKADVFSSELLAKDYSRLLGRLWEITGETIQEYSGVFSQYEASGMIGFFLLAEKANHFFVNVIQCALELKNRIGDLGRQWKIQKGWMHDIELNMGIHVGDEYFTPLASSSGGNFIPLGDILRVAATLSSLSNSGQIWTSKEAIDQLSTTQLEALRFGVFRSDQEYARHVFIPKCFSKIGDLKDQKEIGSTLDQSYLGKPVTQVFDYQGRG
jgi:class 3 adenylate cyclase